MCSNPHDFVSDRVGWSPHVCFPLWSMEEVMWWCGGALLVTLAVIYLEFKAHLTVTATTAFCSDTLSHLVCTQWNYHLFFNRTMTQHISRLCKGYLTMNESDGVCIRWPGLQNHPTSTQLRWFMDEFNRRVKEKQPTYRNSFKTGFPTIQVKLVERLPGVCKAVIKEKGDSTTVLWRV